MIFSPEVREKGRRLLVEGKVLAEERSWGDWPRWSVRSSSGQQTYQVKADFLERHGSFTFLTCTCPFGTLQPQQRATCSHAAAVLLLLKSQREGSG